MFVFTERGEVPVGGKRQPAHSTFYPVFSLCSLIFCVWRPDLLRHGGVLTLASRYTCKRIERDPATGSSLPFLFVCTLCVPPPRPEPIQALIWEPPMFAAPFLRLSLFVWFVRCVRSGLFALMGQLCILLLMWHFLMSWLITSADPQAAQGAGRLPGEGFRPDDTAECQCKNKHANTHTWTRMTSA